MLDGMAPVVEEAEGGILQAWVSVEVEDPVCGLLELLSVVDPLLVNLFKCLAVAVLLLLDEDIA